MNDITFPSEIVEQPEIQELQNYWYSLSRESVMDGEGDSKVPALPSRSAINPTQLKKYLPDIMIMELTGKDDFRIRLFGTNLTDWLGPDRTGRTLSNITTGIETTLGRNKAQHRWLDIMNRVLEAKKPIIWSAPRFDNTKRHHQIHAISLPLTQTTGEVEQILTALYLYIPKRTI